MFKHHAVDKPLSDLLVAECFKNIDPVVYACVHMLCRHFILERTIFLLKLSE